MTRSAPISNSYILPDHGLAAGEYPFSFDRAKAIAKLTAFLDAGIDCFIDLTTRDDPLDPYERDLLELARARGVRVRYLRMGITDMDVPSPAHMVRILDAIDDALARGERPYVHCWGGVGRTGTVVGCFLVRHGLTGEQALAEVARLFGTMSPSKVASHYGESPQTYEQCDFVRSWHEGEPGPGTMPPVPPDAAGP